MDLNSEQNSGPTVLKNQSQAAIESTQLASMSKIASQEPTLATVQTAQRELTRDESKISGITNIMKIDGTAATNVDKASSTEH